MARKRTDSQKKRVADRAAQCRKNIKRRLADMSPANAATTRRFLRSKEAEGRAITTQDNYTNTLMLIDRQTNGTPFRELVADQVIGFFAWANKEYTIPTVMGYSATLRHFWRWLTEDDNLPRWFEKATNVRKRTSSLAIKVIDQSELNELLHYADRIRDQAIIWMLWDTGLRNGELCSLDVQHVEFDGKGGAQVRLPDVEGLGLKTGARIVYIVDAVPALKAWLQVHNDADNPDAPFFTTIRQGRHSGDKRCWPSTISTLLLRVCRRAKLRDINPHLFRHTRATRAARAGWQESEMRAYFGWGMGSKMPAYYTHLAAQDMENQVRRDSGIDELGRPLKGNEKACAFCSEAILATAKKCKHCGEFQEQRDRAVFRDSDEDMRPDR